MSIQWLRIRLIYGFIALIYALGFFSVFSGKFMILGH